MYKKGDIFLHGNSDVNLTSIPIHYYPIHMNHYPETITRFLANE